MRWQPGGLDPSSADAERDYFINNPKVAAKSKRAALYTPDEINKLASKRKIISKKLVQQNTYKPNVHRADEEKVKIKKILKQPVEKKNYKLKDYVVYPKHGVGKIISIEKAKIYGNE